MITEYLMMSVILLFLAAKKKTTQRLFGQMTLGNDLALEFLKSKDEPVKRICEKIVWLNKHVAESLGFGMPEWVMANEKYDWVAILYPVGTENLPLLVYQKSALQGLEVFLHKFEEDGLEFKQIKPSHYECDFGESPVGFSIWRNPAGGKFARFNVELLKE